MGKFMLKKTASGFSFALVDEQGIVLATSGMYTSEDACRKGIASVQKNAPAAGVENQTVEGFETVKHPKFEVYTDKAGEYRFRLKASNGENIAFSEGYTSKASCLKGIESVRKNCPDAEIADAE